MMNAARVRSHVRPKEDIEITARRKGALMSTMEAFLLGLMTAWTPSLVLLAWLLRRRVGSKNQPSNMQH
jgi:hypothetical protein